MDIQTVTKRGVASITTTLITSAFITYFLIAIISPALLHRPAFFANVSETICAHFHGRTLYAIILFRKFTQQ